MLRITIDHRRSGNRQRSALKLGTDIRHTGNSVVKCKTAVRFCILQPLYHIRRSDGEHGLAINEVLDHGIIGHGI